MTLLVLSPYPEKIAAPLARHGDEVVVRHDPLDAGFVRGLRPDWVVSYGYRHIIREPVLSLCPRRIINLHIALLPWNRGADPTFWSAYDGTPKGVSIHLIDAGIDTGDLLLQEEAGFPEGATLAGAYARHKQAIEDLFARSWSRLREGAVPAVPQAGGGSVHRLRDKEALFARLPLGRETPIRVIEEMGRDDRLRPSS